MKLAEVEETPNVFAKLKMPLPSCLIANHPGFPPIVADTEAKYITVFVEVHLLKLIKSTQFTVYFVRVVGTKSTR